MSAGGALRSDPALLSSMRFSRSWFTPNRRWVFNSIRKYYRVVILSGFSSAQIRKAAIEAARIVLKASTFMTSQEDAQHPAASATAKFCQAQIKASGSKCFVAPFVVFATLLSVLRLGAVTSTAQHTLDFLYHVIDTFPEKQTKSTCEDILNLMQLSDVVRENLSYEI